MGSNIFELKKKFIRLGLIEHHFTWKMCFLDGSQLGLISAGNGIINMELNNYAKFELENIIIRLGCLYGY